MELDRESKLLRIFVGELDKYNNSSLYEEIVFAAKKQGMAGATVIRGILSYGASSRIHTAKLLDLSYDLPIIIEIVDHADKIDTFLVIVNEMIGKVGCGAMITIEKAEVLHYQPKNH